jgi:hypothetical protein
MCPLCQRKLRKIEWPGFIIGYDLICECGHLEVKYYGQSDLSSYPEPVSSISPILTVICPDTAPCASANTHASAYACADGITNAAFAAAAADS